MSDKTTIVFLGSPVFACPFLAELAGDDRFEVQAVITQEDKPSGRKMILTPTPVKTMALQLGIEVFQPAKLNKDQTLIAHLTALKPDFLVVVAYGQILSQKILDIPGIKAINVHGSILPKYRGASPIEQSILNNDTVTGLSIMEMVLKMDAGAVYSVIPEPIAPHEDSQTLRLKLAALGHKALPEILLKIQNQQLTPVPQDENQATYCQKITKSDGLCNPLTESAAEIYTKYRAFIIWPGIYISVKGKKLKLLDVIPSPEGSAAPGSFLIDNDKILLGCREGNLLVRQLQLEGKKAQSAKDFLTGNRHLLD
jgi:methionyl-tRNA formyltransferase